MFHKGNQFGRKYLFNEHVFDIIDTPAKAYWLGYLYCDGHIWRSTPVISLTSKDLDVIQKFHTFLETDRPIKLFGLRYHQQNIRSKHLAQTLAKYGIIPNKTYDHSVPVYIPPEPLTKHFWRGCIDADGSISIWRNGQCAITLNNTNIALLNQCYTFFGGCEPKLYPHSPTYFWQVVGKPVVILPTLGLLYNKSVPGIRLDRKYKKYLEIGSYDNGN